MPIYVGDSGIVKPKTNLYVGHGGIVKPRVQVWAGHSGLVKPVLADDAAIFELVDTRSSSSNSPTFSMSFGDAVAGRRLLLAFASSSSFNTNNSIGLSATIGGVSTTNHVTENDVGNSFNSPVAAGLISAVVESGGSGSVNISANPNYNRWVVALYRLVDFAASPSNTDTDNGSGSATNVTVPSGGVVVSAWAHANTGNVNFSQGVDSDFGTSAGSDHFGRLGSRVYESGQGVNVSMNNSGNARQAMATLAWGLA